MFISLMPFILGTTQLLKAYKHLVFYMPPGSKVLHIFAYNIDWPKAGFTPLEGLQNCFLLSDLKIYSL